MITMKIIALSCIAFFVAFAAKVSAAGSSAQCSVTIVPGIAANKNTQTTTGGDLTFGTIIPGSSSGTVTINPSTSTRNSSGGVQLVDSISGPAAFDVTGAANSSYTVTLPNNGTTTISSGNSTMAVNSFSASPTPGSSTLDSQGVSTFKVGGRLEVPANQPSGNYTGTFDVTVAYQ